MKNADPDKSYCWYGIGFSSCQFKSIQVNSSLFLISDFDWGKNVLVVDNISLAHTENGKKDILLLDEDATQRLDYTKVTAETKYSIKTIGNANESNNFFMLIVWKHINSKQVILK